MTGRAADLRARLAAQLGLRWLRPEPVAPDLSDPGPRDRFFAFAALLFANAGLEVLDVAYENRTWILLPGRLVPKGRVGWSYRRAWNRR